MNLLQPFLTGARAQSTRAAIIEANGASVSFADLVRLSGQLAAAWRGRGVARGDRVLVAMPLGILLYASVMALWRLGAVIVFPEPALGLKGLRHAVVASPFSTAGRATNLASTRATTARGKRTHRNESRRGLAGTVKLPSSRPRTS